MYHTDTRCGYSLGDASKAYGCTAYRHVLYLREGLVCIVDDLNLNATRPTTVEFFLHPNGQTSATANVLQVEAADVVLRAAVVDANATLLPLTVREREKTRFATHDVVATRSGQGATRTVTFLRFGAKALLAGQPCRIEPAPGILDFCCGAERWRLGLAPGAISPESSTDAGLWLCRLDGLCPVVAMAVGATPDAPVSVRVGQDTVTGTGCVSWPEPATRRGRLRRWLPFRGP
jgi:hypothetical protein